MAERTATQSLPAFRGPQTLSGKLQKLITCFILHVQAAKRQYELKDPAMRDNLAAARAVLKKHSMMLLTASKAYVRHPELAAAKANRDFVLRQVGKTNVN